MLHSHTLLVHHIFHLTFKKGTIRAETSSPILCQSLKTPAMNNMSIRTDDQNTGIPSTFEQCFFNWHLTLSSFTLKFNRYDTEEINTVGIYIEIFSFLGILKGIKDRLAYIHLNDKFISHWFHLLFVPCIRRTFSSFVWPLYSFSTITQLTFIHTHEQFGFCSLIPCAHWCSCLIPSCCLFPLPSLRIFQTQPTIRSPNLFSIRLKLVDALPGTNCSFL